MCYAGATYRFRVMAVYSNQDNRPSETSARITLASGDGIELVPPDSFPIIVEVKALSVDSLAIRWQVSMQQNKQYDVDINWNADSNIAGSNVGFVPFVCLVLVMYSDS